MVSIFMSDRVLRGRACELINYFNIYQSYANYSPKLKLSQIIYLNFVTKTVTQEVDSWASAYQLELDVCVTNWIT